MCDLASIRLSKLRKIIFSYLQQINFLTIIAFRKKKLTLH